MNDKALKEHLGFSDTVFMVITTLLWGANLVAIKIAFEGISPICTAALRFVLGALAVMIWMLIRRIPFRLSAKGFADMFALSLTCTLGFALFNVGLDRTTVVHGAIFLYTTPFFVAILAHFFTSNDRLNIRKIVSISTAFAGVVLVLSRSSGEKEASIAGDLMVMGYAAVWAIQILWMQALIRRISATTMAFYTFFFTAPQLLALAYLLREPMVFDPTLRVGLSLIFQGVLVGGFTYIFWNYLLSKYTAVQLSVFTLFTPIFGVLFGAIIRHERVGLEVGIGLAMVVAGLWLIRPSQATPIVE